MLKEQKVHDPEFEARFTEAKKQISRDAIDQQVTAQVARHNRVASIVETKNRRRSITGKIVGGLAVAAATIAVIPGLNHQTLWSNGGSPRSGNVPAELVTHVHPDGQIDNPTLVSAEDLTPAQRQEALSRQAPGGVYSESQPK